MKTIDLRSDTVTLPTAGMLEYMIKAPVGDDGRAKGSKGEDPSAVFDEQAIAKIFEKEDALFVPSGTMGNMVSVLTHCDRGSQVVTCANMHLYKAEKGIFDPCLCGMQAVLVPQKKGLYDMRELKRVLDEMDIKLVCIENSYNFEGGTVLTREEMEQVIAVCHGHGIPVHMDGARIFNAAAALNTTVGQLCAGIDSIQFCVSKGLSAPVGSFLVGSGEFIAKAREVRKKVGGQLRQVGLLTAAGLYAVDFLSERVAHDNARARRLAEGIEDAKDISIDMSTVQTNIVKVDLCGKLKGKEWLKALEDEMHVRAHYITDDSIRLVTYRGVSDEDIEDAISRIHMFCGRH